jgi:Ran GTPase-activating protein (RanGAP) involved in mRNA processing and transport
MPDAIKFNSTLITLHIIRVHMGDNNDGVIALSDALKVNKSLTTLHLIHNNIKNHGAAILAEALRVNKTLNALQLSMNSIGDEGAMVLAKALTFNTDTLNTLILQRNNIGWIGIQALADALTLNRSLTKLQICQNGMRDDGGNGTLGAISKMIAPSTNLSTLNLSSNTSFFNVGLNLKASATAIAPSSWIGLNCRSNSVSAVLT